MLKLPLMYCAIILVAIEFANAGPTPGTSPQDGINDDIHNFYQAQITTETPFKCQKYDNDCQNCVNTQGCRFGIYEDQKTKCSDEDLDDKNLEEIVVNIDKCPTAAPKPIEVSPKSSSELVNDTTTSTSTTSPTSSSASSSSSSSSTTSSTTSSSSTTTETSTSTTKSTTTTSKNTTTPKGTTTTSKSSTTAKTPTSTTAKTPVDPDDRAGSKFDGWSFFGGILLTVGIAAIGFISYKCYKVRHLFIGDSGTNYNRF